MLLTFAPGYRQAFFVLAKCLLLTFAPLVDGHTGQPKAAWGILQQRICDLRLIPLNIRFQV